LNEFKDFSQPIALFWFRRDLRLYDNQALYHALTSGVKVLPVFIFDKQILDNLGKDDKRISFIYQSLQHLNKLLLIHGSSIKIIFGNPEEVFRKLISENYIHTVYANHDYEPYAIARDKKVKELLASKGILFRTYKDQVIFEKDEIVKSSGEPYTVFTPYSKKWLEKLKQNPLLIHNWNSEDYLYNFLATTNQETFSLEVTGFKEGNSVFQPFVLDISALKNYGETRDFPALDSTSKASVHLRFGTISIRQLILAAVEINSTWLNEFIWREFFMQILWHFPQVINSPFKPKYQFINWINNENEYDKWCRGETGYPMVDAGMRELNETGFMHNRVRMVTSSFLAKHLLINWQWGEAYFAEKLLDFELSSNNGNWQWAAGTGCDSAPYFRIFNPISQAEKFDPDNIYIKKWVPEYNSKSYARPVIEHSFARIRCLSAYKTALMTTFNNI
jgi:deoxyribodipyrimidine photo-lyase